VYTQNISISNTIKTPSQHDKRV